MTDPTGPTDPTCVAPGRVYRHVKGGRYLVLAVARHTETGEDLVVYVPLYEVPGPPVSARPLAMFTGTVEVEGRTVARFAPEPAPG